MQPSDYINAMGERQLASLLYRDHIGLKHSKRERLRKELETARLQEAEQLKLADRNPEGHMPTVSPFLKALMAHIPEACVCARVSCGWL